MSTHRRKICVVTGSRAEYGLLYYLLREIQSNSNSQLQLVITGTHLLEEFGQTQKEIEKDGFSIDARIPVQYRNDSANNVVKITGTLLASFADVYENLRPDILVLLGDRYEMLAAASAALIYRIPIAHLHGGESTVGAFDEAIRHSITKMSHLHFTASAPYQNRVIQLGEHPKYVFQVGGLGVDIIHQLPLLSKNQLQSALQFEFGKNNLLVTLHPETLSSMRSKDQTRLLLKVLAQLKHRHFIFTGTNADTDNADIKRLIHHFVSQDPKRRRYFENLGQLRYLSCLQFVEAVVGNSSSGLLEAPSFKIATINIGKRQQGRLRAKSVIDCDFEEQSITTAFETLHSPSFQQSLDSVINPYGKGGASKKIFETLLNFDLTELTQKTFYDLPKAS